tara:strand:+ start:167 stop:607 length:441 start_codon:yes stop_codon:yes gene_type:complete
LFETLIDFGEERNLVGQRQRQMVVDVIDIRKRIEKIRNEVSEAIVSKHSYNLPDENLREDVSFSIQDAAQNQTGADLPLDEQVSAEERRTGVTDTSISMHNALTKAMAMPAFNLNIKNRQSSGLLITLILLQVISNVILMAILLLK